MRITYTDDSHYARRMVFMFKIIIVSLVLLPMQAMADEAVSCLTTRGGNIGMQIHNICDRAVNAAWCVAGPGSMCTELDTKMTLGPGQSWNVGGHNVGVRYNGCFGQILKIVGTRVACQQSR